MMKIQLSDHFHYGRILRFTLPSILTMVFTSLYGVVDGFFVSNYVGKNPFAAVNFIMPVIMVLGSVGFMFGTGGSAIVARTMGEGKQQKARDIFSLLIYALLVCGVAIAVGSMFVLRPVASAMGAQGELLENCLTYGRILLISLPFQMLQYAMLPFAVTAEKPNMALTVTLVSGLTNMALDALFMGLFRWGIVGAAWATAISQILGGAIPLAYFALPNSSLLRLGKAKMDGRALLQTCTNGSSELVGHISFSMVGMLYNVQLLKYAGENGVSAYGVIMYVSFLFAAIFIGYSTGIAPVFGFHYGAGNRAELRSLRKKSTNIIVLSSVMMCLTALLLARPLASIFVGYDQELMDMTVHGFSIYSMCFLFAGMAIFGPAFFTALSDGLTSAIIAFMRTLLFQIGAVLLFPMIWGLDGIWWSVVAADLVAALVSVLFMFGKRKRFGY